MYIFEYLNCNIDAKELFVLSLNLSQFETASQMVQGLGRTEVQNLAFPIDFCIGF